jgi:hypothetical protein|tara:strand:+ start:7195 stop:7842 length:648 start_codon:yes stop_codon:yes gene_type:complete
MSIPYYSAQQLWQALTTESIGFYTRKTFKNIPDKPGIYAWLMPLKMGQDVDQSIKSFKKILSYSVDSRGKDILFEERFYQWQNIKMSVFASEDHKSSSRMKEYWDQINSSDEEVVKTINQIVLLSSIFTRPLYIGLASNLSGRHQQHISGSLGNDFHRRFANFVREAQLDIDIEDLVFAAVPLSLNDDSKWLEQKSIKAIEYVLKNVAGPIFGEK